MSRRRVVRVLISGRVQGVGYRDWTVATAVSHGLTGWVRNRRNGQVEALFVGPDEAVGRMLEACRRGPGAARVDAVEILDLDLGDTTPPTPGFRRLATI